MPQIVYGVMAAHRTHDITIPRPDETVRFDKPNACNQCHFDWSVNRAITETQRLWPKTFAGSRSGGERFDEPERRRALFQGDAVMRALTVAAMMPATDVTAPLMMEAMQDRYPIVRYFAANALAANTRHCRNPIIWRRPTPATRRCAVGTRSGPQKRCTPREMLAND